MKKLILLLTLAPCIAFGQNTAIQESQDKITLITGQTYYVHILNVDKDFVYFYSTDDSTKTTKKVPKTSISTFDISALPSFPIDSTTNTITYTAVIKADSVTSIKLYENAKLYFVNSFKSSNDVIQLDNINDKIIGKGYSKIYYDFDEKNSTPLTEFKLYFTIQLKFKEGRYKYILNNMFIESIPSTQYPQTITHTLEELFITNPTPIKSEKQKRVRDAMIKTTKEEIDNIIKGLITVMESNTKTDDDW